MRRIAVWNLAGLVACFAIGCGDSPPEQPAVDPAASEPAIETVEAKTLPKLNDPLEPMDEGRLSVAIPTRWSLAPRGEALVQCRSNRDSQYPAIAVTAETFTEIEDVTLENVDEFADAIKARVADESESASGKLVQEVKPVQIGKFVGVEYVQSATEDKARLEVLHLVTAKAGRKYTVALNTREGTLFEFGRFARAMAGGLRFTEPAAERSTEAEEEAEPAEAVPTTPASP